MQIGHSHGIEYTQGGTQNTKEGSEMQPTLQELCTERFDMLNRVTVLLICAPELKYLVML